MIVLLGAKLEKSRRENIFKEYLETEQKYYRKHRNSNNSSSTSNYQAIREATKHRRRGRDVYIDD